MQSLPVAVIGAGPVGLAAAAHLVDRGMPFVILDMGECVGASVRAWGHVRLFSPWEYDVDPVAARLLGRTGWSAPDPSALPTGAELVERYLGPLARHGAIAPHVRLGVRVTGVARRGFGKTTTAGRDEAPFALRLRNRDGIEEELLARAVIDASGTWTSPNPLGGDGLPAIGEAAAADRIAYGIPDVLGADRARYANRRVLVVGSGHSAMNVLLDLADLQERAPGTTVRWAIRRAPTRALFGGGAADALPARGSIGTRARALVAEGRVELICGFSTRRIERMTAGLVLSDGSREIGPLDEIVCATGFRPALAPLRELRLALDDTVESPVALAPLIDPNVHSCGTVPPHGFAELRHPEKDFYVVGMKSYGRAPTFLMRTGYEQVRSVVAALAGDLDAAHDVQLVLPQTGVCSSGATGDASCCRPPSDRRFGGRAVSIPELSFGPVPTASEPVALVECPEAC